MVAYKVADELTKSAAAIPYTLLRSIVCATAKAFIRRIITMSSKQHLEKPWRVGQAVGILLIHLKPGRLPLHKMYIYVLDRVSDPPGPLYMPA